MRPILSLMTRLYLALTILSGVPAVVSRAVLCVAPNGHIAIEMGESRCEDYSTPAANAIEGSGIRTAPDCCGDCVDVPMVEQVLSAARHGTLATRPEPPPAFPMLVGDQDTELFAAMYRSPVIHGTPPRASFPPSRTAILRN